MEWLQQWLDQSPGPVLSAFILGLMMAFSPCPLATNITAIAYISREFEDRKAIFIQGLLYTLGRLISYTALGTIIFIGASAFRLSIFFQRHFDKIIGPLLILAGLVMLGVFHALSLRSAGWMDQLEKKMTANKNWGSLLLGMLFALSFCPYSGVLYFGILMPLAVSSTSGLLLLPVFAVATGLPVIIIAWLLAYTVSGVGKFYNRLLDFERIFRKVVAVIFLLAGLYFSYLAFIK